MPEDKKITILFLIDHFRFVGGTENHLVRLVKGLDPERFSALVVGFDVKKFSLIDELEASGVKVAHIPVGRFYNWDAIRKGRILSRLIKENHVDIVQTYHVKSDTYGSLVARWAGVRRIVSSKRDRGHSKTRFHFWLNRLVNPLVSGFIVVSDAVKQVIEEKEGVSSGNITTIYNGVDSGKFHPPDRAAYAARRAELGIRESDIVLGSVAWFRPEKGHEILFRTIERIHLSIPRLRFIVVGDGPLKNRYTDFAREKGFLHKMILPGAIEDVRGHLQAMDIACLVSESEGFSNAVLEKMATGLPMIVTDVGGNAEAVINGYNGVVIPPGNVDALAEAIRDLVDHPSKREEMGRRSRQRVEEVFSVRKMVRSHETYYENLMAHPQKGGHAAWKVIKRVQHGIRGILG
jgi:glycosyltransferase involved in cell wall biosynthesis